MGTSELTKFMNLVAFVLLVIPASVVSETPGAKPALPVISAKVGALVQREVHWVIYFNQAGLQNGDLSWTEECRKHVLPYLSPPKSYSFEVVVDQRSRVGWIFMKFATTDQAALKDFIRVVAYDPGIVPWVRSVDSPYSATREASNFDISSPNAIHQFPWLVPEKPRTGKQKNSSRKRQSAEITRREKSFTTSSEALNAVFDFENQGNVNNTSRHDVNILKRDDVSAKVGRKPATKDLLILSQPPSMIKRYDQMSRVARDYWFYTKIGAGVVVYVIDSGFDPRHPELRKIKVQDWIFPGSLPHDEKSDDISYHGSSVASKIAGGYVGIAPRVEMVIVKAMDGTGALSSLLVADMFRKIRNHIVDVNSDKFCIINISMVWTGLNKVAKEIFMSLLSRNLSKGGVIIVAGAGNGSPQTPISTFPQDLMFDENFRKTYGDRFVVVGGYDVKENIDKIFQSADFVQVSGPSPAAVAVPLQDPYMGRSAIFVKPNSKGLGWRHGTSFSTPAVTAMIAMWISSGVFTVDNVVQGMYDLAYNRTKNGPKALWNGITEEQMANAK
ncbi:hypothetical protein TWF481_003123 [Arthrobotrys musiformis]|uniref:Peptidase S8/S53 domain-containing protein n=1 Tax=Arthrobotrys musiformis TaxID=47236 RepID=A0AAV9VPC1_9PEZI